MSKAVARAGKEFQRLQGALPHGVKKVSFVRDNLLEWTAMLEGPEASPYAGGKFELVITLSDNYPNAAPKLRFANRIFHPVVEPGTGKLCEGLLAEWAPTMTIKDVLIIAVGLFDLSTIGDAGTMDPEAARLLAEDPPAFHAKAKEFTAKYAK